MQKPKRAQTSSKIVYNEKGHGGQKKFIASVILEL
jgi:hypothetical protein